MKNRRTFAFLLAVAIVIFSGGRWMENPVHAGLDPVFAQEDWKNEFEDVCSKTQDAMTLGSAELNDLIARCDKLKPLIERLDETQKKVYLKRLGMCRDLYVFVKESKEKK